MQRNHNSGNHHWHAMQQGEIAQLLDVNIGSGLDGDEVARRQREHGPNRITPPRGRPAWLKFLEQFNQPLVYVLLLACSVTGALGEWVDSSVIFGVVLINAIVGYLQESKAERAIEALSKMVVTEATVRRGGQRLRIPSVGLVPGDVVILQAGDRVPADLRLAHARGLQVDESALTGESAPVSKQSDALALDTILADRKNNAYAGTLVTAGLGEGLVWAIGDQTETGRIAHMINTAADLATPLTRKIAKFSRLLLWVILALAAATFGVGVLRGENAVEMFMAAVALAVGAIPEGLPAAVTIVLAIGVARMAKRRAIIRKLPAVETLGSTTVICSDKTGTLTENKMTVQRVFAAGRLFEVTGSGYETSGELRLDGAVANPADNIALSETLRAGLLCNDSTLLREETGTRVQGDPTEAALIVAAAKAGLVHADSHRDAPRVDMIPFESEHMFRATLHGGGPRRVIYKVGAVERLLESCVDALDAAGNLVPLDRDAVRRSVEEMAARGLRVLAMARRHVGHAHDRLEHTHVAAGLTFLGLQGMMDPPRAEVIPAIRRCREAGVSVKMITGDHAATARAIAAQIGIVAEGQSLNVLTGRELESVTDDELPAIADRTNVFARVAPEQKLRLVRALQSRGHIIAMTGDGVNDAPALKQADIGIAMGITGTDVAKGASAMILTDDNFASIEAAVHEGRGVFDNLVKFIVWTLPTNVGEALLLFVAILLGSTLPALPVQLLWVNMATALLLGLTLVFEPKEPDLMSRPPRDPARPLLNFPLMMRTGLVALLILGGGFLLYHRTFSATGDLAAARTATINTIVVIEVAYLVNCRSLNHAALRMSPLTNLWVPLGITLMILAQLAFTYAPMMNRLFHTAPLSSAVWLEIAVVAVAVFLIVELEKRIRFHKGRRAAVPE